MEKEGSAIAEIPNFKLAKVGKEREPKRGGAGWWGARGAGSGFGGALGGSGVGMPLAKTLVMLAAVGVISAGAWQFGRVMGGGSVPGAGASDKIFADKGPRQAGDASDV